MTQPVLTVSRDAGAGTVTLAKGDWRAVIAAAERPAWVRLYRRLRARVPGKPTRATDTPGPYARHYDADLRALEAAVAAMKDDER